MADSYETIHGTRFRARWYDATGKRRAQAGFLTRRAAEAHENDEDSDKRKERAPGRVVKRSTMTVQEWVDWWSLHDGPQHVAPATYNSYLWAYSAHARRPLGGVRLTDLVTRPHILQEWRSDLARATDRRTGEALKHTTRAGAEKALSAILSAAVDHGHLPANPLYAATRGRRRRGRAAKLAQVVQPAEPISLVGWCLLALVLERHSSRRRPLDTRRDAALVRVSYMAGLRMPSEAIGLRWRDVVGPDVEVSGRVSEGEWEPVTKTISTRSLPLMDPLREELTALHDAVSAASGPPAPGELIWHLTDRDGAQRPWSPSAANNWRGRIWRPAARLVAKTWPDYSQIERATPYEGRHAYVSVLAAAHVPTLVIASYAGHSVRMTEEIYGRVVREMRGRPAVPPEQQIAEAQAQAVNIYDADPPQAADAKDADGLTDPSGSLDGS